MDRLTMKLWYKVSEKNVVMNKGKVIDNKNEITWSKEDCE